MSTKLSVGRLIDRLNSDQVRIATVSIGQRSPQQVEFIEKLMIQLANPPYNTRWNSRQPMQVTTDHLSPESAQLFLQMLPDKIRLGLLTYAAQTQQPLEAVIEMAIAGFLDEDAISFSGCNPLAVVKNLQ